MLDNLKSTIRNQEKSEYILEEASKRGAQNDVRDVFLDDINTVVDGAEEDPKIAKLANALPESDETELTDEELNNLVESAYAELNDPYLNTNYTGYSVEEKELKDKPFTKEDEIQQDIETMFENFRVIEEDWIKKSGPSGEYGKITQLASFGSDPIVAKLNKIITDPLYKIIHGNIDTITDITKLKEMHTFAIKNAETFKKYATKLKLLPGYRITYDQSSEWWTKKAEAIEKRMAELKNK